MPLNERLTRLVIGIIKEGVFGGRIDMSLGEFDVLERALLDRAHPGFRLLGNAREGTWHMAIVIAGTAVDVFPDRTLDDYSWRVEVRE